MRLRGRENRTLDERMPCVGATIIGRQGARANAVCKSSTPGIKSIVMPESDTPSHDGRVCEH